MKKLLSLIFVSLLLSGNAFSKNLEYYCSDISSSPLNHSWFNDKGKLTFTPVKDSSYKYNIIAGSTLFTGGIKANGIYTGSHKNKYSEISFSFTERNKTGFLIIVSKQYSSPVDIRFKCNKKPY